LGKEYEARCKVCNSPNRAYYETLYYERGGKISFRELERKAKEMGENISFQAFRRHFMKHYSFEVQELVEKEGEVTEVLEKEKKKAVNLAQEIRNNLLGLKALLDATLSQMKNKAEISPQMLRALTEIYREHRQTLQACEELSSKLSTKASLSEQELLKVLYFFSKDLCPNCLKKFKFNLDEYLRRKRNE